MVAQPPGTLNDRLTAAFAAAFGRAESGPALLIGMDTPQVTPRLLDTDWQGADAVLGLSEDGGFWAIGLRPGHPPGIFDGVPMSTDRTGSAQLARLTRLGLRVGYSRRSATSTSRPTPSRSPYEHPELCTSPGPTPRSSMRSGAAGPDRLFDRVYAGRPRSRPASLAADVGRWRAAPTRSTSWSSPAANRR